MPPEVDNGAVKDSPKSVDPATKVSLLTNVNIFPLGGCYCFRLVLSQRRTRQRRKGKKRSGKDFDLSTTRWLYSGPAGVALTNKAQE